MAQGTWLKFGVTESRTLVNITDVSSGKTDLYCPYCGQGLIAKKGKIKEHHFAHLGETCRVVTAKKELPVLPIYDNFNLYLSGQAFDLLKSLWKSCGVNRWIIPYNSYLNPLIRADVLSKNVYSNPPGYEFTQLGQIPVGALPLREFNQIQEPLILKKLFDTLRRVEFTKVVKPIALHEATIDLWLYRTQLKRILSLSLYFLEVKADGTILYKIGVTGRTISQRMAEINRDLSCHYKNIQITPLGLWKHRGNVELYFKHRYRQFNYAASAPNSPWHRSADRVLQI